MSRQELIAQANEILNKKGFSTDGSVKRKIPKAQKFFERRILMTPMGNGSR